ncbi:MAG: alpha/beta hydrolase [Stellaceae bacterium]
MSSYAVDIEEVEYLRHGETAYLARIFRPRGQGPFPAVVEAHGGAWTSGARTNNDSLNRAVAEGGVVVAALDFRNPPAATYPGSVQDVNFGIRWLKSHAAEFSTRADWVGTLGTSSGGHLAVLAALKPFDPRYSAIARPGIEADARVPFVVTLWPVICPLGRYRVWTTGANAERVSPRGGNPAMSQVNYWLTEEAMAEGSAVLALGRGDAVELPHILYLQDPADPMHPGHLMEDFVRNYRQRGGMVRQQLFKGTAYDLPRSAPDSPEAKAVVADIVAFIHGETG